MKCGGQFLADAFPNVLAKEIFEEKKNKNFEIEKLGGLLLIGPPCSLVVAAALCLYIC